MKELFNWSWITEHGLEQLGKKMTLQQIWSDLSKAGYETDKGSVHSYIEVYEEILVPYRETAKNVLEVGLFNGHSVRMWEQYFINAKVYGIDCAEQPHGGMADLRPMIAEGTHNIIIGDATDDATAEKYFGGIEFQVIIDDAAHHIKQQVYLFNLYRKYLSKGGVYIIEDLQRIEDAVFFLQIQDQYNVSVLDRRHVKGRYDDILVIITDK